MSEMKPGKGDANQADTVRLDDEARVKVLSPWMLVFKRFVRNRLAILGLIILCAMFVFSFGGILFSPYGQKQVFYTYAPMDKEYANMMINNELRYIAPEGQTFSLAARAQFVLAITKGQTAFEADGKSYGIIPEYTDDEGNTDFYRIVQNDAVATALGAGKKYTYKALGGYALSDAEKAAFETEAAAGSTSFTLDGAEYTFSKSGKTYTISRAADAAMASMRIFDAFNREDTEYVNGYAFRYATEKAIVSGESSFVVGGTEYMLDASDEAVTVYRNREGAREEFAIASTLIANPSSPEIFITVPFKNAVLAAINAGESAFAFTDEDGLETEYRITRVVETYTIKREVQTMLHDTYAAPSGAHWLGTDGNGMDVLTRLMYGGRISLLVGFVVVCVEVLIGVVFGGVAGYFGKWVDTSLMRFIDLFTCIPHWPLLIILGAVMDQFDVTPYLRILFLMLVLGLIRWPGIARIVRGQILSLREQDFMVATEATGIRVSRRIFRHLVPNVMPLLIVRATMSLGTVILLEATLSFLGLGLKYPMASWGTIINAATDVYVMTNFWFIWIPAGLLILLTVLGFNFVGDGLRDAFDPKMKR